MKSILKLHRTGIVDEEKRTFNGGIIKRYDHDERRWLIEFYNNDALM